MNETKLTAKKTKLKNGKYRVERSDGKVFHLIRSAFKTSRVNWTIEDQDTYEVYGAPTIECAMYDIEQNNLV